MNILQELATSLRFLGLSNTLLTLYSTLEREFIEWRFHKTTEKGRSRKPGPLRSASQTRRGGSFEFTNATLEISFLNAKLVHLSWGPGKESPPYAVVEREWPQISISFRQTPQGGYRLSSPDLCIEISTYGKITFTDAEGQTLRSEHPPQRQGPIWTHSARLEEQERIHGLGEKAGPLNLRLADPAGNPAAYEIRNQDIGGFYSTGDDPLYFAVPLYLSRMPSKGYLIYYDNPFRGTFTFDHPIQKEDPRATASFQGGLLRYYFTPGTPKETLQTYTELTGRPPLPPNWALGYHQCRWGYRTADQVREVVQGFKDHDLPLSAFHLDIDYMDGYRVFTIHQERFPNLSGLAKELSQEDIHLVAILDPCVKKDQGYKLFKEGLERDVFCSLPHGKPVTATVWPGRSVFPDFSNPETRQWWGEQYPALLDQGVEGFWHDMNEPSAFTAWGEPTLPLSTRYNLEGLGGDHTQGNNLYGLLMNKAGFEALAEQQPDRRPWVLSRSGWAGNQRYAWNWTGDVTTSWEALQQTLVTMLNLGLSGIPYTGSDIGGFGGHPSAELFTRWFQMAAFTPFFRGHSASVAPRREPWIYGEPYTDIIRRFLRLRYQLLPYLYTLAWNAHQTGHPFLRPLSWAQADPFRFDEVEDAFLLGEHLLVAPVLEEGQATKQVTFPDGGWYSYWDDTYYQGPDKENFPTSLERIPLFVRAGSVLPLDQDGQIHLHLYPPREKTSPKMKSELYQDQGDGYGPHRVDHFTVKRSQGKLRLTWKDEGEFPFPGEAVTLHIHGMGEIETGEVDGEAVTLEANGLSTAPFKKALFPLMEEED